MRILNIFCLFFFALTQNQNSEASCILPPLPPFGNWTYVNKPVGFKGLQAPENSILKIECSDEYKMDGPTFVFCVNGKWDTKIGRCLKKCPSIFSTPTMNVTCSFKGHQTVNCTEPIEGTLAEFKCASFYEDAGSKYKALCFNGKWSEKVSECAPVCGRAITKKRPTYIVNADETKKGDFPWQIAIYTIKDKNLICGGSLLTEKIVLTAAHCITDNVGTTLPTTDYVVVAGKYYRQLDHPDDQTYGQVLEIEDMFVSDIYEGENKDFIGDIAILITKKPFKFSARVQPVCIDWSRSLEKDVFGTRKQQGFVSGWGNIRENSNPSNELRSLKVPCLPRKECHKLLPDDFTMYITHDKFCAGYKDNSTSVCLGDSGGGLVFKRDDRYYIMGIVSVGPTAESGGCDSQHYTLYTLVYDYIDNLILEKMTAFKSETTEESITTTSTTTAPLEDTSSTSKTTTTDDCILPNQTKFEKWSFILTPDKEYVPGSSVPVTGIRIECKENSVYSETNVNFYCSQGHWTARFGKCLKPCSTLSDSPEMKVTCRDRNGTNVSCTNPTNGTIAKFKCASFYEFSSSASTFSVCVDGKWSKSSDCVPKCGRASYDSALEGRYPWHVAIYYKVGNGTNYDLVCGGTMINSRLIITAAHCVAGYENRTAENFMVAVNNYYRQYRHPEDVHAQFSRVAKILTVENFLKNKIDIAAVVTIESFNFSKNVRPVCLSWKKDNESLNNRLAFINGFDSHEENRNAALEELTKYEVLTKSHERCLKSLFNVYGEFYTRDKFCARYLHATTTSLCYGNTGGGLILNKENKSYLVGVLSLTGLSGENRTCSTEIDLMFTKVEDYIENFILHADAESRERKNSF